VASEHLGFGPFASVFCRNHLSASLSELGEFDEAATILEEAIRIAEELDSPWGRVSACLATATCSAQRGDTARAISESARGLDLCITYDLRLFFPQVAPIHGYVLALAGQCGDGIALMERAVGAMRVPPARISHTAIEETRSRARLSEAYLLAGNPREARDTALAALQSGEQYGQKGQVAWVHRVLGEIARLYPSLLPDSADHHYCEAHRRAEDLGMRPLVAHCHLGLGKLNCRSANRGQAEEHLTIATAMYREMGMAYWLEQAQAELRQLG
jgi:hypothetical protein